MAYGGPRPYPNGAYLLTLIGGILITLVSFILVILLAAVASFASGLGVAGAAAGALVGIAIAVYVVALILGLVIIYGALQLKNHPEGARTWGIIIVVLALISYIGGGGYFIGLILALIGGILAIIWRPPAPTGQMGQPGQTPWAATPPMAPPQAAPLGATGGQRFCASCGSPNPAGTQFCAKCGAAMPP